MHLTLQVRKLWRGCCPTSLGSRGAGRRIGSDISSFTEFGVDDAHEVGLELPVGFGHSHGPMITVHAASFLLPASTRPELHEHQGRGLRIHVRQSAPMHRTFSRWEGGNHPAPRFARSNSRSSARTTASVT